MAFKVHLVVMVLVVTAATTRSTICLAVLSSVLVRSQLVDLIRCASQVENVQILSHNVDVIWHGMQLVRTSILPVCNT